MLAKSKSVTSPTPLSHTTSSKPAINLRYSFRNKPNKPLNPNRSHLEEDRNEDDVDAYICSESEPISHLDFNGEPKNPNSTRLNQIEDGNDQDDVNDLDKNTSNTRNLRFSNRNLNHHFTRSRNSNEAAPPKLDTSSIVTNAQDSALTCGFCCSSANSTHQAPVVFQNKSDLKNHIFKDHSDLFAAQKATNQSQLAKKVNPTAKPSANPTNTDSMEAFCRICQKEVCNKYFLKSHLLNKHGVQLEDYIASYGGALLNNSSNTTNSVAANGGGSTAASSSSSSSSSCSSTSSSNKSMACFDDLIDHQQLQALTTQMMTNKPDSYTRYVKKIFFS